MTFEDKFMDVQASMVSLCIEYVKNQAERIYIYIISEKELLKFDVFYKIKGEYVQIHQINRVKTIQEKVDDSRNMQRMLLDYGLEDIQNMIDIYQEYNKEHPTEMWLVYDAVKGSLDAKYSYEGRYEKDDELLLDTDDEFNKWFDEVKNNNL